MCNGLFIHNYENAQLLLVMIGLQRSPNRLDIKSYNNEELSQLLRHIWKMLNLTEELTFLRKLHRNEVDFVETPCVVVPKLMAYEYYNIYQFLRVNIFHFLQTTVCVDCGSRLQTLPKHPDWIK